MSGVGAALSLVAGLTAGSAYAEPAVKPAAQVMVTVARAMPRSTVLDTTFPLLHRIHLAGCLIKYPRCTISTHVPIGHCVTRAEHSDLPF
jgi:hypothetical protein